MNKKNDDGGPAFPTGEFGGPTGMTLRDYFAGKAFQACIANGKINEYENRKHNGCLNWCYSLADGMIEARKPYE